MACDAGPEGLTAEAAVLNNFHCAQEAGTYRGSGRRGYPIGTCRAILDEIGFWTRDLDCPLAEWACGAGKSVAVEMRQINSDNRWANADESEDRIFVDLP